MLIITIIVMSVAIPIGFISEQYGMAIFISCWFLIALAVYLKGEEE